MAKNFWKAKKNCRGSWQKSTLTWRHQVQNIWKEAKVSILLLIKLLLMNFKLNYECSQNIGQSWKKKKNKRTKVKYRRIWSSYGLDRQLHLESYLSEFWLEGYKIWEMQWHLIVGKRGADQIFFQHSLEKYMNMRKTIYYMLVDLEEASDELNHNDLWNVWRKYEVEGWLPNMLRVINDGIKVCLSINGMLGE